MCLRLKSVAAFGLLLALAPPASAQIAVVDQQYPAENFGFRIGRNIAADAPLGQSFTPTFSSLDTVEFYLQDFGGGVGATISTRLRLGSGTSGTVLGTSAPVVLPNGFGTQIIIGLPVIFSFPSPIPLTPGNPYTFELVHVGGDPFAAWGKQDTVVPGGYPGGSVFVQGGAGPEQDLFFREGIAAVPEPSVLLLASAAACGVAFRARRPIRTASRASNTL